MWGTQAAVPSAHVPGKLQCVRHQSAGLLTELGALDARLLAQRAEKAQTP